MTDESSWLTNWFSYQCWSLYMRWSWKLDCNGCDGVYVASLTSFSDSTHDVQLFFTLNFSEGGIRSLFAYTNFLALLRHVWQSFGIEPSLFGVSHEEQPTRMQLSYLISINTSSRTQLKMLSALLVVIEHFCARIQWNFIIYLIFSTN